MRMIVISLVVMGFDVVVDIVQMSFAGFRLFADLSETLVFEEVVHEHDAVQVVDFVLKRLSEKLFG